MATRRDRGRSISDGIQGVRKGTSEVSIEFPKAAGDPLSSKAGILQLPQVAPELPKFTDKVGRGPAAPHPNRPTDNAEAVLDYCRMELRKLWDVLRGFEGKGRLSPLSRLGSFLDQEGRIIKYYDPDQDKVVANTNLAKLDADNPFAGSNTFASPTTFNGTVAINGVQTISAKTTYLASGTSIIVEFNNLNSTPTRKYRYLNDSAGEFKLQHLDTSWKKVWFHDASGDKFEIGQSADDIDLIVHGDITADKIDYISAVPTAEALTSGTTVSVDWATGDYKTLVLAGNVIIENPSGESTGQVMQILIKGHASTTYTVSWDTQYMFPGGAAPTHPGPGVTDIYTILCQNGTIFHVTYAQDFS